jgi:hypothetical protein
LLLILLKWGGVILKERNVLGWKSALDQRIEALELEDARLDGELDIFIEPKVDPANTFLGILRDCARGPTTLDPTSQSPVRDIVSVMRDLIVFLKHNIKKQREVSQADLALLLPLFRDLAAAADAYYRDAGNKEKARALSDHLVLVSKEMRDCEDRVEGKRLIFADKHTLHLAKPSVEKKKKPFENGVISMSLRILGLIFLAAAAVVCAIVVLPVLAVLSQCFPHVLTRAIEQSKQGAADAADWAIYGPDMTRVRRVRAMSRAAESLVLLNTAICEQLDRLSSNASISHSRM